MEKKAIWKGRRSTRDPTGTFQQIPPASVAILQNLREYRCKGVVNIWTSLNPFART